MSNMLDEPDHANFMTGLNVLIEEFLDYIHLKDIGFPEDWEELVRNNHI